VMSNTNTTTNQKHDIFVGNLAFNTTEEQLHQVFSEVGRLVKVRMVTDSETGKPRGFAFVEFQDPQAALSAIRNMNDYELNGRRIRVNFSNSSHLEALAGKLGMDLPNTHHSGINVNAGGSGPSHHHHHSTTTTGSTASTAVKGSVYGTVAVADALKDMTKGELYDVVAKLKEIADRDHDEARRILSGHPQLPEAILFCLSKLDMVQTPVTPATANIVPINAPPPPPPAVDPRLRPADPRSTDPRTVAAVSDPRARVADPRQKQQSQQPLPQPLSQQQPPPPQPQLRASDPRAIAVGGVVVDPRNGGNTTGAVNAATTTTATPRNDPRAGNTPNAPSSIPPPPPPRLDPALVQQVMSLTPEMIAQLPPQNRQHILTLRNQITGGR